MCKIKEHYLTDENELKKIQERILIKDRKNMENDAKVNKKKGKKRVLTAIIAVLGFVIGYNIKDLFLDILLGGRPF